MKPSQRRFLDEVSRATSQHFALNAHSETTFEAEVATLCAIVGTMTGMIEPIHVDKVLDCLHAYVMRLRSKQQGALQLAFVRLSELQLEREGQGAARCTACGGDGGGVGDRCQRFSSTFPPVRCPGFMARRTQ